MAGSSGIVPAYNRHASGNLDVLPEIPSSRPYGGRMSASTRAWLARSAPGLCGRRPAGAYRRTVFRGVETRVWGSFRLNHTPKSVTIVETGIVSVDSL
jgi:hypothetical protein